MSKYPALHTLLWGRRIRTGYWFAAGGYLLGCLLLLLSVHVYENIYLPVNRTLKQEANSGYLIINKEVGLGNTFGLFKTTFDSSEIDDIRAQPFISGVGAFTANRFRASVRVAGVGGSDIPLEAVDASFLDTVPANWDWKPGDAEVPVILSNEFLNLYNFVMAPAWKTPQISRGEINSFRIDLDISGNGGNTVLHAKVMAFSDRIVSVLVPQSFMQWANIMYGSRKASGPERLIIKVRDPGDPALQNYLDAQQYDTNRDQLKSNAVALVSALIAVMSALGLLILLLALFLFLTTFRLLIARQQENIALLFQLGYTIPSVSRVWQRIYTLLVAALTLLSLGILYVTNYFLIRITTQYGLETEKHVHAAVLLTALIFASLVIAINRMNILKNLRSIYR